MKFAPYYLAAALVAGPIAVGTALFLATAPSPDEGVFISSGQGGTWMYQVSRYSEGTALSFTDIGATAVAATGHQPEMFQAVTGHRPEVFLMGAPNSVIGSGAASAQLYVFVVNHADRRWITTLVPVPSTIQQVNPLVYRLRSAELSWMQQEIGYRHYRDVLAQTSAPRDSIELMAGIVIDDRAAGVQRLYAFRIGPQ